MKVIFAHDHFFYKNENSYYSTGGLSKKTLERYTSVFDKLTVLSRQKNINKLEGRLTLASSENIDFIKIPNFKSITKLSRIFEARKKIEKEVIESDAVIARLPSSIGSIAVTMAKKHDKPYLIEVVACPWDALWNHSFKGKLLAPFGYVKLKKQVRTAPFVIYVTNSFLQNRYPTFGKKTNCSNVALTCFDDSTLVRREQHIRKNKNKLILGTTAAIDVKYKGQQYVIKALSQLKKEGITNYEYQLVGSGDPKYLKKIAKKFNVEEQVKFIGNLSHKNVFGWLENIDIYIQPSRQEGLPRALIEAMSKGAPAFGAKTGGIPELLDKEYIFSNSKTNISEIISILTSYSEDSMIKQARKNYLESKKYDSQVIEKRRKDFLMLFRETI